MPLFLLPFFSSVYDECGGKVVIGNDRFKGTLNLDLCSVNAQCREDRRCVATSRRMAKQLCIHHKLTKISFCVACCRLLSSVIKGF